MANLETLVAQDFQTHWCRSNTRTVIEIYNKNIYERHSSNF